MSLFKTQREIEELELYQDLVERFAEYLNHEDDWMGDKFLTAPRDLKKLRKTIEEDIKKNLFKKRHIVWDVHNWHPLNHANVYYRLENIYNKAWYKHPWDL